MNNNTVLAIAFLIAGTLLTTTAITTMVPSAYADNKQKAEDDSAAAIADCDDNEVEEARFLCIALATNDVEIETEEEPPEEEATLAVCKEVNDPTGEVEPNDFSFTITTGPNTITIEGQPPAECQPVGDTFPGEYTVTEARDAGVPEPDSIEVEGCTLVDDDPPTATGEIPPGGTERCVFINTYLDS
jgi:hypothetical protein